MKNALSLNHLSIGFKKTIMENISIDLEEFEFVALMGVNGVGKSSLLKTIARLQQPLAGEIKLNKKNINEFSAIEFARLVAVVLTEKFQFDYLRVNELVAMGRSPYTHWHGKLSSADEAIVAEALDTMEIKSFSESFFSNLSDGQKQKVMIARALAQQPQILILDEPTTYLDIPSKIELLKCLKRLTIDKKMSVILSTHDLDLVEKSVDRIWLMGADGSFIAKAPQDLHTSGAFKKHFKFEPI